MYKINDWAICLPGFNMESKSGGSGYKEGILFQIRDIDKYEPEGQNVIWTTNRNGGIRQQAIRPATEEEIFLGHAIKPNEYEIY